MASVANALVGYNYMFLVRDDGTPYQILYQLVGGHPVLYPAMVIILFLIYIAAFYGVYMLIEKKLLNKSKSAEIATEIENDETALSVK
jgi:hypothetical protein